MFDPFDLVKVEERATIDEEMITVPIGSKVLGIDEGMFMGIIIGILITQIFMEE